MLEGYHNFHILLMCDFLYIFFFTSETSSFKYVIFLFLTEQRHLTDTQFRLVDNSNIQKQLNEAAEYAEMDLKAKQIDKNVEVCVPTSLELLYFIITLVTDAVI